MDLVLLLAAHDLLKIGQGLSRDDNLEGRNDLIQLHPPDCDAVPVQTDHTDLILVGLKQSAGHQLVCIVDRDREDRLLDHLPECKLTHDNRILPVNGRK